MKKFLINLFGSLFITILLWGVMFVLSFIFPFSIILGFIIIGLYAIPIGKVILCIFFLGTWYIIFNAPSSMEEFIKQQEENNE